MLLGRDKTKARPRKERGLLERKLYSAELKSGVLAMKLGAHVKVTNAAGEVVDEKRDATAALMVNIGDRLVVSGNGDATVVVTKIEAGWNEKLHVEATAGSVADGSVFVLNAKGLGK